MFIVIEKREKMKILVVDSSNSSMKFSLFDESSDKLLLSGLFERIGFEGSKYTISFADQNPNYEAKY